MGPFCRVLYILCPKGLKDWIQSRQVKHDAYVQAAAVIPKSQISEDEYPQQRNVVEHDLPWDKENKTPSLDQGFSSITQSKLNIEEAGFPFSRVVHRAYQLDTGIVCRGIDCKIRMTVQCLFVIVPLQFLYHYLLVHW